MPSLAAIYRGRIVSYPSRARLPARNISPGERVGSGDETRGRVGQRGWSSATYAFCGIEYRTQPTRSQGTVEAKRARRKQEKV